MASPVVYYLSLLLIIIYLFCKVSSNTPHRKYEYKYCFKGPYLAQHDGTVPFWEHGGHAQPSDDRVRITSSLKSQKGFIWTKFPSHFQWWEAEITFRITSQGRVGADGLAFWFTEQKGIEGPIFGSNDRWKGLGIMFDSFDNDGKSNNPFISAVLNDGTKSYDHEKDGTEQQMAGCLRDYRNKPHPTKAKIEYYNNVLTVMFHSGLSQEDDYEMCLRQENVYLSKSGYFGVSAATGALADDHDVLKFILHSLSDSSDQRPGSVQTIPDSEKEKFSKEYDQFSSKLEQQKEEFKKQHPDRIKKEHMYETAEERELRQIYDGQNAIFRLTRELNHKCDEIIGRQERTLSLVQGGIGGGSSGQVASSGGVSRHELETLLSNQREMVALARDIKSYVSDVHKKIAQGDRPADGGKGINDQLLLHEIRDGMSGLKKDVSFLSAKQPQVANCPTLQGINCITTGYFILFIVIQLAMFCGYIMYKNNKDAQAKKFY